MEYQERKTLLENIPNQPTKFRTKNWVEINDDSRENYNNNNQIKFKTSKLMSSLCDYSHAYLLPTGTKTITGEGADNSAKRLDERNNGKIF